MPSINSTAVTEPNVRFGATFLNTDYSSRAVNDEVLMDKTTGELAYKRPIDGRFLYYDREKFNTDEFYFQLQIMLNNSSFWLPDITDKNYLTSYLMMVQYNLNEFVFDPTYPMNFEDGGKKKNQNNDSFTISREAKGFIVKISSRPRDEALINFVTAKYDNYYKNYTGNDQEKVRRKLLYKNQYYDGASIEVRYRLTWLKNGNEHFSNDFSGYVKSNQSSFIEFSNYTPPTYDEADAVRLQILSISLPKFSLGKELMTNQSENVILRKITDSQEIRLTSCEITTTITENDTSFIMPDQRYCTILLLDTIPNMTKNIEVVGDIGGGSGGGVLLSTPYPSSDQWRTTKLWLERFRDVDSGGELTDLGSSTKFDELEAFFGKPLPTSSTLTTNALDTEGFYVETIGTKDMSLSW